MPYETMSDWLACLRDNDELLTIDAEVDPYLELGAICRWFLDHGPNKALLFNNVKGHHLPVLANVFGTRRRLDLALNLPIGESREGFVMDRWKKSIKPIVFDDDAPCHEVSHTGEGVDLDKLPIPWHNEGDGGRYISIGILVTKDPDGQVHNLSYARVQVREKAGGGIQITPNKHARLYMEAYHARGQAMPFAIVIGGDPVLQVAAAASPPFGHSEYELAGALRGEPVHVTKCLTSDLLVPSGAEIVLEGEIPPGVYEEEGPFGEFTGHYGDARPREVIVVKAVTHRKNPVYQTLYTGIPVCDNHILQELLRSAKVWERVKQVLPNVTAVYCPPEGGNGFTVWISLKKKHDGEARLAMMAAWTSFEYVKHVFVTDDDVDIYNPRQREWVLATRVQADHDVLIVPGMVGMALDPSAQAQWGGPARLGVFERPRNHKAVMGVDCTRPMGVKFEDVVTVSPVWMQHVERRLPELLKRGE